MLSKDRNKQLKRKLKYVAENDICTKRARKNYQQNADTVKHRNSSRAATDSTLRKKKQIAQNQRRSHDDIYTEKTEQQHASMHVADVKKSPIT